MDLIKFFESLLLGLVQGATEFLPVSSSGHLYFLEKIGIGSPSVFFNLALHIGTLFAAAFYYRKKIFGLLRRPFCGETLNLLTATLATFVVAMLFKTYLREWVEGEYLAFGFLATSGVLIASEVLKRKESFPIDFKRSLVTGIVQGIAVIPGLSRSGATISALMIFGADREEAANFSFLISMPVILGGALATGLEAGAAVFEPSELLPLVFGMIAAAVSGYFAVGIFVKQIKKRSMLGFAAYTFCMGFLALITAGVRM
ncbi:MAG: undecaprenyl-diphosphate phosphatase [Clostridiales bacterium]|jgi:undecaprenyl-diphosphatase|nr:undecaprenyl-diphosphate phosphatase [Clostridiales bacterium]